MKILKVDELVLAADMHDLPGLHEHIQELELATQRFADALSQHLGIKNYGACYDGDGLGVTVAFYPSTPDQICPSGIEAGDPGGDWEEPPYEK